ncbi:MAG: M24 family metallopeptidase [Ilumatobacter sp.]
MPTPSKPSDAERDLRWSSITELMSASDVDVVLAHSDLGDKTGYQRYISGYRSFFGDVASMLFTDRSSAMVVTNPGVVMFAKQLSWIDNVVVGMDAKPWLVGDNLDAPVMSGTSVGEELGKQLSEHGATRIGLADMERFPGEWRDAIATAIPGCTFVDLRAGFNQLRLVKSAEELDNIRAACGVADEIWAEIASIARIGRTEFEVLADLEHRVRLGGCEDSYNMFFSLPMFASPVESMPSATVIEPGDAYIVEVSPRFNGYYGQETALVSFGPVDPEMRAAYDAINRARECGVAQMRAGNDITDVVAAVDQQLTADGYQLASPLIGHFVGLELEEPRVGADSFVLEAGMVFICHPFVAGWPALMRADTYLIGVDGAERLTTHPLEAMEI